MEIKEQAQKRVQKKDYYSVFLHIFHLERAICFILLEKLCEEPRMKGLYAELSRNFLASFGFWKKDNWFPEQEVLECIFEEALYFSCNFINNEPLLFAETSFESLREHKTEVLEIIVALRDEIAEKYSKKGHIRNYRLFGKDYLSEHIYRIFYLYSDIGPGGELREETPRLFERKQLAWSLKQFQLKTNLSFEEIQRSLLKRIDKHHRACRKEYIEVDGDYITKEVLEGYDFSLLKEKENFLALFQSIQEIILTGDFSVSLDCFIEKLAFTRRQNLFQKVSHACACCFGNRFFEEFFKEKPYSFELFRTQEEFINYFSTEHRKAFNFFEEELKAEPVFIQGWLKEGILLLDSPFMDQLLIYNHNFAELKIFLQAFITYSRQQVDRAALTYDFALYHSLWNPLWANLKILGG